jgi:hypothetical protein
MGPETPTRQALSDGYYEEAREGQIIPAGSLSQPGTPIDVGPGLRRRSESATLICVGPGLSELPRTLLPGNTVNKGERGAGSRATGEQTQLPARRKPSGKTTEVRVRMLGRHFPLASTLAAARRESINAR